MNNFTKLILCAVFLLICISPKSFSQSLPQSYDTTVQISLYAHVNYYAVRIAKNPVDHHFYYITFDGSVYKIIETGTGTTYDTLIATSSDHNINFLQGLAFYDSTMYLVGNHKVQGSAGYGLVCRATQGASGSLTWDTVFSTVPYQSTSTLYDHAFGSICVTPNGDSLYIGSGSRTDHGEVQSCGGLFPGTRDVPLTSMILKIPSNLQNFIFLNDSAWLDSTGFVFARGVRNTFDMAFAPNGDLFGTENSGDRDDPDEMNWLRQGHHYGFPWEMGGHFTGQQFPNYNPDYDLLVNHNSLGWQNGYFYNDSTYPQRPANLVTTSPIGNLGPDADKFRDPDTGIVMDASDSGIVITTFTPHRSPLGLVFDKNNSMGGIYTGDGFVLSYTIGSSDSSGAVAGGGLGPLLDAGEDLLHIQLIKDTANDNYNAHFTKVIGNFLTPVDAEIDSNNIYVLEYRGAGDTLPANVWKITFPPLGSPSGMISINNNSSFKIYPNPASSILNVYLSHPDHLSYELAITDVSGQIILNNKITDNAKIDLTNIKAGVYFVNLKNEKQVITKKIVIIK